MVDMTINRRRAASSKVSSERKLTGHRNEGDFSSLIEGHVISGTQKADVRDGIDFLYSVKSGKKWQIFLYGHDRIEKSKYLSVLTPCLDAFTENASEYFSDRNKTIEFKEQYLVKNGRKAIQDLTNEEVYFQLGPNEYIEAKNRLRDSTLMVAEKLKDKVFLRNFLAESIFNNEEVSFLAVKDSTLKKDNIFNVFHREDVLKTFTAALTPGVSRAGYVPIDFNVDGQKTLLCYDKDNGAKKNLVEIEIRNDSDDHYRRVRFNMYSKDALTILLREYGAQYKMHPNRKVRYLGKARELL